MPTYLVHGFRWPRQSVHIHVILHHLDDAAANWTMGPQTTRTLLEDFIVSFPEPMDDLPNLRFIEEYDPSDPATKHSPYAYVVDVVEEIKLSYAVNDVIGSAAQTITEPQLTALTRLRNELCPDAEIEWYIVVCGDVERGFPLDPAATLGADSPTNVAEKQTDFEPKRQKSRSRLNSLGRRKEKGQQSTDDLTRAKSSSGLSHRRQSSESHYRPVSGLAADVPPVPRITSANGIDATAQAQLGEYEQERKQGRLRTALKRIF